jgi:membrane protein implicated in regulation of membrane protease activity
MDEILNWHWWMYVAVLFFIIEVFTPGFIVACLGLGSLVAAITAYMGYNIDAQFIAFSASTLISLFLIRPLLYKKGEKQDKIKTNTEALIGRVGSVSETIDNSSKRGRVLIDGDQWKSSSHNNEIIELNAQVEVISIDSTIITVKKV